MRSIFRITIREMLLLTFIAAMSAGWWLDHHRFLSEAKRMGTELFVLRHSSPGLIPMPIIQRCPPEKSDP
jgi:hypothetical protein